MAKLRGPEVRQRQSADEIVAGFLCAELERKQLREKAHAAFITWSETHRMIELLEQSGHWDGPDDFEMYQRHFDEWWGLNRSDVLRGCFEAEAEGKP